ncbi:hypothetical protein DUNSADRAFT_12819 [Dunaliella salina]|uniref:Encoded protein n=1 Tax=Dunaliella salina TaxID=3046 RepID=A0ABQ7H9M7_DUNSA|nr:hypothetical protein DUNSADRAFT_12819 [Dunaliella salina]|eukprot:KAF5843557.1 hypothetical protein DUNSADRAFT_12819 [Dunaliella salina]
MLAGEALRSRSNDFNAALDALIDPSKRAGLTLALSLRIATEGESQDLASPKRRRHASGQAGAGSQGEPGPSTSTAAGGVEAEGYSQANAGNVAGSHDGRGQRQGSCDGGDGRGEGGGQDAAEAAASDLEAEEMQRVEDELMGCLEEDPMAAYDVDVAEEGSIIDTYRVLLSTAQR